jgi:hypothetical protein
MSDFDKRPPGDDDLPDWLNEPADQPRRDDRLGFTGELDWQALNAPGDQDDPERDLYLDDDDVDPTAGPPADEVDWMQTLRQSPTGPLGGTGGLTGQLDWQQPAFEEPESLMPTDDDLPPWMRADALPDEPLPGALPGVTRGLWMDDDDSSLSPVEPPPAVSPLPRQTGTVKRITTELPPADSIRQTGSIKRLTGELPPVDPIRQTGSIKRITGQLPSMPDEITDSLDHDPPMTWLEGFRAPETDTVQPTWLSDARTELLGDVPDSDLGQWADQPDEIPMPGEGDAFWLRDDLDDGSPLLSNEELGLEPPVPLRRTGDLRSSDEMPALDDLYPDPVPRSSQQPMTAEDLDFLAGPLPIPDEGNLDMPDLDALLGAQRFAEEESFRLDNAEPEPDGRALWQAAQLDDGNELPLVDEQLPAWDASMDDLFSEADRTPPPDFNALLAGGPPDLGTIRLDDRADADDALLDPDAGTQLRRDAIRRTTDSLHLPDGALDSLFADEPESADFLPPVEPARRSTGEVPTWLDQPAEADENADIFSQLGLPTPATGYDFLDNQPAKPPTQPLAPPKPTAAEIDARMEWFNQPEDEAAGPAVVPDWLQRLDTSALDADPYLEAQPPAPEPEAPPKPAMSKRLADLKQAVTGKLSEPDPNDLAGLEDVDRLLAGYSFDERSLPQTANLENALRADFDLTMSDVEVDKAFTAREQSRDEQLKAVTGALSTDAPDWLREAAGSAADSSAAGVEQVSAAAIIRKQGQREVPLDELSGRLQALSQKGRALPTAKADSPGEALSKVLPGLSDVLPALPTSAAGAATRAEAAIPADQARNIGILESLVGLGGGAGAAPLRTAAIDLTLDTPATFDDIATEAEAAAPARARKRGRRLARFIPRLDRLAIALLLVAAVGLPMLLPALRIGTLPPAAFIPGGPAARAWSSVETVHGGDLVLIAAEYGPTGAAELDPALAALTEHILARGGRPVLVSGNPVGLLHAEQVIERVVSDPAFILLTNRSTAPYAYGSDYFVARYLPGDTIGLRSFAADVGGLLALDSRGGETRLNLTSLRDFRLIVLVAERADDVRAWAEQIAPLAAGPLVVAVGQGAAVLAEPYLVSGSIDPVPGISGLLVGVRDAYTYGSQVQERLTGAIELIETRPPTQTPTADPGLATATPEFTPTPEATATPAALLGEIDASDPVNVRAEPSTTAAILTRLNPGATVAVIGRTASGDWVQVELSDGQRGWVSAQFIRVRATESGAAPGRLEVVSLMTDGGLAQEDVPTPTRIQATIPPTPDFPSMTGEQIESMVATLGPDAFLTLTAVNLPPSPTPQPSATLTPRPSRTPEASGTPSTGSNVAGAGTHSEAPIVRSVFNTAQETHWYSITLGLVMIIAILLVGLLVNLVGGLFRRERERE